MNVVQPILLTPYSLPRITKRVEVKVVPIEYDLEQVVQCGDADVAAHVQTPPDWRVDLEEQDVELVTFGGSVWLDHNRPQSRVAAFSAPGFSRSRW
jgi:predicted extracellular nuclease